MKSKNVLLAAAAILGFGTGQVSPAAMSTVAQATSQTSAHDQTAINNGSTTRAIEADAFGGYTGGILRALMRNPGHPPREWGMSRACARMVRKNRMVRAGISRSRI